jgi:hypothetical protein
MKPFLRYGIASFGLAMIGLVVFSANEHGIAAQGQGNGSAPVTVLNTPLPVGVVNTPLPVTGSVSLSGTTAVTLSGTPTVAVSNTALAPLFVRNTDEPARTPYVMKGLNTLFMNFPELDVNVTNTTGKRFVIEYVSVHASVLTPHSFVSAFIFSPSSGQTAAPEIHPLGGSTSTPGAVEYGGGLAVRMYVEPNEVLRFVARRDSNTFDAYTYATVTATGYLVEP